MANTFNKSVFSKNLKHYMKINGKTRKEVCDALDFSYFTFSDWVNGKKYPRIDKVEKLADYFGILKSDLIEDKKNKPAENSGLTEAQIALIEFVRSVPAGKAALVLRTIQAILADDL